MKPPRIFVELSEGAVEQLALDPANSHYLSHVLRLGSGDQVEVIDRKNARAYEGSITTVSPVCQIALTQPVAWQPSQSKVEAVSFGLCKGAKNDLIIEKLTELGVRQIICLQTSRSVLRISAQSAWERKEQRWNRIAEAACRQSGRNDLPNISFFDSVYSMLEGCPLDQGGHRPALAGLCCALLGPAQSPRNLVPPDGAVHLMIGPEGDFAPEEYQAIFHAGFQPISLGPLVLRAETAVISAVAGIEALWGA